MWFVPLSGNGWVETGHTAGWLNPAGKCEYFAFRAWNKEDGSGYTEVMFAELNSSSTTTDEFQISRSPTTNVFYIYWNGNRRTTSNVQFWNSRGMQMGAESISALATAGTFNMQGRGINQSGVRVAMPGPQTGYVNNSSFYGSQPATNAWTWRIL